MLKKIKSMFIVGLAGGACFAASYDVPVPSELLAAARWENVEASAVLTGTSLDLRYRLPEALVGRNQPEIRATGTLIGSFIPVEGKRVGGYCVKSEEKPLACLLHYPRKIVDVASRDEVLAEQFSGLDFQLRSRVARLFGADPAGLLIVELSTSN